MINFQKAEIAFKEFLQKYNIQDGKVSLKIRHTYKVVEASEFIAKDLNLSEEDIELAKLIALLHDIGRFEQLKRFDSFLDAKTIDHADLGVQILKENNFIRTFIQDSQYNSIILKAIKNHNKLKVQEGLTQKELLHANIIRDADKTDNFRVKTEDRFEDILHANRELLENSKVSEHIYNNFMNNQIIIHTDRVEFLDYWISYLAFLFDFNFTSGLKYIKEKDYVNKIVDRLDYKIPDSKEKMEEIRKHALEYIDNRLKNI